MRPNRAPLVDERDRRLAQALRRLEGMNLYLLPAGSPVKNPLELLNLREVKLLLDRLPSLFNWIILDSPPLLFAADANLLSTMCHGTLLVVRIGHTTIDSVTRAMQSLCNNNVVGIVVNGARRGELYSKYTYYHSYYTPKEDEERRGLESSIERERAALGDATGNLLRLENQLSALIAYGKSMFHRESAKRQDQAEKRQVILDQLSDHLRHHLESADANNRLTASGSGSGLNGNNGG
jgi:Mrp family chromosome partitioning ATPase